MKTLYKILLVVALGVGLVTILYAMRDKPVKNGFNRGQIYSAQKLDALELKSNSWYINRLDSTRIVLSNYKAVLAMFSCRYDLQDSLYQKIPYDEEPKKFFEIIRQIVVKKIEPSGNSFSADGFMNINDHKERIIYTYYYRNSFACLDVNLKVLYRAKMIDTNSVAKIKLGEYQSGEQHIRTMAAPAKAVNKRGYSAEDWFYNHSALAADNEASSVFEKQEVLDVYRLDNGKYSHSIYLPKYPGRKLTDIAVHGNVLIALYEKVLVTYLLPALKSE
ncbi:hypothetical protein ABIE26_002843 [Pedobacter africanus]|uniref:Uncharacterized protein n=1 Tax=Pedobacter africanus TaxID=151894 RepID=A0ACC6KXE5_9SPHI|nr:hypothetical protein [Pedobacter africanus]MDR6783768.1 hypothetical protein [Pedobacter africanus]